MHATSETDGKAGVGDTFPTLELTATSGQRVTIPDPEGDYVHLQLRRFAGCPICNLHLRTIVTRHDEIRSHGIREVDRLAVDRGDCDGREVVAGVEQCHRVALLREGVSGSVARQSRSASLASQCVSSADR